jgi:hypothetical protein
LAPYVVIKRRDWLLLRALVAVLIIILITSMFSPQVALEETGTADIRYVISVIPFGIFIVARVILAFSQGRWLWLIGGVLFLQFFNFLIIVRLTLNLINNYNKKMLKFVVFNIKKHSKIVLPNSQIT